MSNDPTPFEEDTAWTERLRPLREPAPEPRPFLYARLEPRLRAESGPAALPWWLRRPAYAGLLAGLVLALNVGAAVRYAARQLPTAPPSARYAAFVADYQLDPFHLPHE